MFWWIVGYLFIGVTFFAINVEFDVVEPDDGGGFLAFMFLWPFFAWLGFISCVIRLIIGR